jgi:ABC-type Na+ efflux pump permease subunit
MRKFLAVVKHEYKKIVLKWSFIIGTLLFPIIAAGFAVVPAIIFSIKGDRRELLSLTNRENRRTFEGKSLGGTNV